MQCFRDFLLCGKQLPPVITATPTSNVGDTDLLSDFRIEAASSEVAMESAVKQESSLSPAESLRQVTYQCQTVKTEYVTMREVICLDSPMLTHHKTGETVHQQTGKTANTIPIAQQQIPATSSHSRNVTMTPDHAACEENTDNSYMDDEELYASTISGCDYRHRGKATKCSTLFMQR